LRRGALGGIIVATVNGIIVVAQWRDERNCAIVYRALWFSIAPAATLAAISCRRIA